MLRTNSKKAIKNIQTYIINHFNTTNENNAKKILDDLKHISNADEITITEICPSWNGISATFRLWWD